MMVVYPCSPRVFLVPVALLLTVSLLTVFRSNYGLPSPRSSFPHLASLGRGRGNVPVKEPPAADTASKTTATCSAHDLDHLRQPELGLTKTILYTRRCIKPIRSGDLDRDAVANISTPLITGTIRLNPTAADCPAIELPACEPISLHVPPTYPEQQHRHLLFGVASRYERLNESLPVFAHWLAGTGARLVAVAADAELPYTNFDLAALEAAYRRAGIDARIIPPSLKTGVPRKTKSNQHEARPGRPPPIEQLHLMLIRDLLDADADEAGWRGTSEGSTETRWLGVLDDDTFFPSLYPLARELARHDHARPALLGQLADSLASVRRYGVMAYGGAGVFVSVPLARRLAPRLEDCIRESESNEGRGGTAGGGDVMLRDCVRRYTAVSLTLVEGLHQLDIRGDPSGFFESGRRVLSLHHWKSWYRAPVPAMAAIARVCGDCFLQRFRFGRDTLLANGYSITTYSPPRLLDALDLSRVEATWQHAAATDDEDEDEDANNQGQEGDYGFAYGPLRRALGPAEKKSWRLVTTIQESSSISGTSTPGAAGRMRQVYVHRARRDWYQGEGKEEEAVDEVIELVWEG